MRWNEKNRTATPRSGSWIGGHPITLDRTVEFERAHAGAGHPQPRWQRPLCPPRYDSHFRASTGATPEAGFPTPRAPLVGGRGALGLGHRRRPLGAARRRHDDEARPADDNHRPPAPADDPPGAHDAAPPPPRDHPAASGARPPA